MIGFNNDNITYYIGKCDNVCGPVVCKAVKGRGRYPMTKNTPTVARVYCAYLID